MAIPLELLRAARGAGRGRASIRRVRPVLPADFDQASVWAAATTCIWYAFGLIPLQPAANARLGLSPEQSAGSVCAAWLVGAAATLALALTCRQPIAITVNTTGLIYLGTLGTRFSFNELVGAYMAAGLIFLALSLHDASRRLLAWFPLPIVMGVVAGSFLATLTDVVSATVQDVGVAGAVVLGYLLGRAWNHPRVPPVGLAFGLGGMAVALAYRASPVPLDWSLPAAGVGAPSFSGAAILAVSLPYALLVVGRGYVPAMGLLASQGYRPPSRPVLAALGLCSLASAVFGGPPATVSRDGGAILASPEAGPREGRYWAAVLCGFIMIGLALGAHSIVGVVALLPRSFILALAGVALFGAAHQSLEATFSGTLRFGAVVAFVVAATPFELLGVASACWALPCGLLASLLVERSELLAHWREQRTAA
jgi:benzoate membrane transport protein